MENGEAPNRLWGLRLCPESGKKARQLYYVGSKETEISIRINSAGFWCAPNSIF
uniref:Uncharacterized protein n=1 Tax=Candidatus Kentrum sp. LPFa TaxID=2126335 RepID=A0A450Y706_9GAMM|nr:MAG: hypothetical protein BECKLPF1236A_GA0070988_105842 [Candidatus Kentron sp. LPFa]VFK37303.1 MAG: hypothetical protein BECKLPF1236C_GA0070990_108161 [Candidatus Kentron sp. LPFa]